MKNGRREPPADLQEQFAQEFVQQTPGPVLVVGSAIYAGRLNWRLRHPQGIGVDMLEGDGVDVVQNLEHAPLPAKFAHIEVLSVLEHTQRPWKVADNLESMLMEGGSIFVSLSRSIRHPVRVPLIVSFVFPDNRYSIAPHDGFDSGIGHNLNSSMRVPRFKSSHRSSKKKSRKSESMIFTNHLNEELPSQHSLFRPILPIGQVLQKP